MSKTRMIMIVQVVLFLLIACSVNAEDAVKKDKDKATWRLEVFGGMAYNFNTNMKVEQDDSEDLDFGAQFKTGGASTPYYAWRVGKWKGDRAIEFEHIHHTLRLDNNPPEIQEFEISHGWNMFMVNSAWKKSGLIYRAGGGIVVAHPESTVRGETFDGSGIFGLGFYLSGVTGQFAVEKTFNLSDKWFAAIEAKVTAGYARVPISDGHANVTNIALHGLIGIGYNF